MPNEAINKRREIIQDRVNDLAKQGFKVEQKYISLFMSQKIKELILTKDAAHQKINQTRSDSDNTTSKIHPTPESTANNGEHSSLKEAPSFSSIFSNFTSKN